MTETEVQASIERPASLSQVVYEAIAEAIMNQSLSPSGVISEVGLARGMGVSKTPVREALMRFREMGLVEPNGAQGLRVVEPSRDRLVKAFEVRIALEAAIAEFAAERASSEEVVDLQILAQATLLAARNEPSRFRETDKDFHFAMIASARNAQLEELARRAFIMVSVLRARDVPLSGDSIRCAGEHVEIADAIAASDGEQAAKLLRAHLKSVSGNVLAAYDAIHGVAS